MRTPMINTTKTIFVFNCPEWVNIEDQIEKNGVTIRNKSEEEFINENLAHEGTKIFCVTVSDYHELLTDTLQEPTSQKLMDPNDTTIIVLCPQPQENKAKARWRDINGRVGHYGYESNNEKALFFRKHRDNKLFVSSNVGFHASLREALYGERPNCVCIFIILHYPTLRTGVSLSFSWRAIWGR